ncbi:hypothetical protein FH972_009324 [Carpinus fangiana]|uniref:Uncharacterized protein n=1 Tax=Carpinus fangiana TaxID=176857 RepID=A0A5N6R3S3_9ROSI|nr:hypothetical protein FH972_009324 [Carpinus fangiana]
MEVDMSLNALVRLPLSNSRTNIEDELVKHSLFSSGDWENDPKASAEAEALTGGSSEGKERNASSSISEVSTSFLAQD